MSAPGTPPSAPFPAATRRALPPTPLHCEECDEPATADDWIAALQALICPRCIEGMLACQPEHQP